MKKILLVEDNEHIRENVVELIELEGYKVIAAADGKQGLQLATTEKPDLILSDVMMPELNGHQLFDELQKMEATRYTPFVFFTSSVEKKDVQYAIEKGASGYIKKPFEEEELFSIIRKCLGIHAK